MKLYDHDRIRADKLHTSLIFLAGKLHKSHISIRQCNAWRQDPGPLSARGMQLARRGCVPGLGSSWGLAN